MLKVCSVCKQEKPLDQFKKRSDRPHLYRSECLDCARILKKQRKKRDYWERLRKRFRRSRDKHGSVSMTDLRKLGYPESQKCYLCGRSIEKREDAELDHIVPLAKDAEHKIENLAWAHHACNRIKHDLTVDELKTKLETILQHHGYGI